MTKQEAITKNSQLDSVSNILCRAIGAVNACTQILVEDDESNPTINTLDAANALLSKALQDVNDLIDARLVGAELPYQGSTNG